MLRFHPTSLQINDCDQSVEEVIWVFGFSHKACSSASDTFGSSVSQFQMTERLNGC